MEGRMVAIDALKIALAKEKEAVEVYKKLMIQHPVLKDLFDFLINEEEKHVVMIEKKISELFMK
jgi:rubrerythrin